MVGPPQYPGQDPAGGEPGAPGYGAPVPNGQPPAPPAYPGQGAPGGPGPGWYQASDGRWYQQTQPPGYAQPPALAHGAIYPYPNQPSTNGMAVAALVCSLAGLLCGIGAILGIVFGFVARSQIRQSGGTQKGDGMALAGIIIGFAVIAIAVIVIIIAVANAHSCGGPNEPAC